MATDAYSVKPIFLLIAESDGVEARPLRLRKGESLKLKGAKSDGLYMVSSGLLILEVLNPSPRILRLVGQGEMAGFGYWKVDGAALYQLRAVMNSELKYISSKDVDRLMTKDRQINQLLVEHLIQVIRHKNERIAALQSQTAEERVLRLLSWLAQEYGHKRGTEIVVDVPLGRNTLAQMAGVTPETYSRMVSLQVEKQLLRRHGRQFSIPSLHALKGEIERLAGV